MNPSDFDLQHYLQNTIAGRENDSAAEDGPSANPLVTRLREVIRRQDIFTRKHKSDHRTTGDQSARELLTSLSLATLRLLSGQPPSVEELVGRVARTNALAGPVLHRMDGVVRAFERYARGKLTESGVTKCLGHYYSGIDKPAEAEEGDLRPESQSGRVTPASQVAPDRCDFGLDIVRFARRLRSSGHADSPTASRLRAYTTTLAHLLNRHHQLRASVAQAGKEPVRLRVVTFSGAGPYMEAQLSVVADLLTWIGLPLEYRVDRYSYEDLFRAVQSPASSPTLVTVDDPWIDTLVADGRIPSDPRLRFGYCQHKMALCVPTRLVGPLMTKLGDDFTGEGVTFDGLRTILSSPLPVPRKPQSRRSPKLWVETAYFHNRYSQGVQLARAGHGDPRSLRDVVEATRLVHHFRADGAAITQDELGNRMYGDPDNGIAMCFVGHSLTKWPREAVEATTFVPFRGGSETGAWFLTYLQNAGGRADPLLALVCELVAKPLDDGSLLEWGHVPTGKSQFVVLKEAVHAHLSSAGILDRIAESPSFSRDTQGRSFLEVCEQVNSEAATTTKPTCS